MKAEVDEYLIPQELQLKVNLLLAKVQDLLNWIVQHRGELIVQGFFVDPDVNAVHNSQQMMNRLQDVMVKAAANVSGYHKELELASKQINKALLFGQGTRTVHFGVRGDVAIDYGGGYGKAIQSKSCFAARYQDVDEHIKKAALQLTGEKLAAETPGAFDRRILDVSILNPENTWPLTQPGVPTPENVRARVHKYVTEYAVDKKGYNKFHELHPGLTNYVDLANKRSRASNVNFVAVDFVVKIRWNPPKTMLVNGGQAPVREIVTRTTNPLATMGASQTLLIGCK